MGTSCDTIDPEINFKHGRKIAGSYKVHDDSDNIRKCAKISKDHNIMFKINTVVTALNKHEDLSAFINEINPMRWKVFQVLPIEGENYNNTDMETLSKLLITSTDFHNYVERNKTGLKKKEIIKPENNETMLTSYILIDEYGRFLDCSKGAKTTTPSILEVGIEKAYQILIGNDGKGFNTDLFKDRGGYYPEEWKKSKRI